MTGPAVPDPVGRVLNAADQDDSEAFLDCFTEDGAVNDWGRVFRGREAIRGWSDSEFVGARTRLTVTEVVGTGDEVAVTADVVSNGFNGPSTFTFTLEGDRVRLMRITG